uniref:B-cell differentiation antigen CD72 n=1 Tax=Otus sunia TaxID=257818 RepID=A0A8C8AG11_9STRI
MAQSVVYADLRFAKVMGGRSMASQALEAGESLRDPPRCPHHAQPRGLTDACGRLCLTGRWSWRWCIRVGLLATCLLLLVATVTLGACYWQVTRRLQDTSREHAAEQGRLEREVSVREQSLEQTRLELAWARAELQRAWQEGNSSQLELRSLNAELERVTEVLEETDKEMQEVREELRASESTVSSLRTCVNIDCCPLGWVLYRGKCLFISTEKKTWWDSYHDCKKKSASLLVQGDWPMWTVPVQSRGTVAPQEGAQPVPGALGPVGRGVHGEDAASAPLRHALSPSYDYSADCWLTDKGNIEISKCTRKCQWICEQPPKLSRASETLPPFLVKD